MEHKKVPCIFLGNQTKYSKPVISKYYDNNKHEYICHYLINRADKQD